MSITATGIYKQPDLMRYLVAASATFQSLVGAADTAQALAYTVAHGVQLSDVAPPRCIIERGEDFNRRQVGTGVWAMETMLVLSFELEIPLSAGAVNREDEHNWFMNQIGAIQSEMEANSGQGEPVAGSTHLNVQEFSLMDGPDYLTAEERETFDPDADAPPQPVWFIVLQARIF